MQLKRGITICSELQSMQEQIFITNGSAPAKDEGNIKYFPGSYVPQKEWRELSNSEWRMLKDNGHQDYSKSLYLAEIPTDLKDLFLKLGLHECKGTKEIIPKLRQREKIVKDISARTDVFLKQLSSTNDFKFHRITRALPGYEMLTRFYIKEEYVHIGLHIDQSRRFTPHTAHKSGNRISINLSSETRYLAFVNLTVLQALNMIKKKVVNKNLEITSDNISSLFFAHYPNYPVLKIAQKPYQYYVAPTDNFFHDATTVQNKVLDITLVYTGTFDMNK